MLEYCNSSFIANRTRASQRNGKQNTPFNEKGWGASQHAMDSSPGQLVISDVTITLLSQSGFSFDAHAQYSWHNRHIMKRYAGMRSTETFGFKAPNVSRKKTSLALLGMWYNLITSVSILGVFKWRLWQSTIAFVWAAYSVRRIGTYYH